MVLPIVAVEPVCVRDNDDVPSVALCCLEMILEPGLGNWAAQTLRLTVPEIVIVLHGTVPMLTSLLRKIHIPL